MYGSTKRSSEIHNFLETRWRFGIECHLLSKRRIFLTCLYWMRKIMNKRKGLKQPKSIKNARHEEGKMWWHSQSVSNRSFAVCFIRRGTNRRSGGSSDHLVSRQKPRPCFKTCLFTEVERGKIIASKSYSNNGSLRYYLANVLNKLRERTLEVSLKVLKIFWLTNLNLASWYRYDIEEFAGVDLTN